MEKNKKPQHTTSKPNKSIILGVESSCDDTGLALYIAKSNQLFQTLHTQITIHQPYGGVVPELAARDHLKQISKLLEKLLRTSKYKISDITAIAYTAGPGLMGSLLVGSAFANALGLSLNRPMIPINHLEAHFLIAKYNTPTLTFPFLVLLVSGGHTQIILAKQLAKYQILGETLDDAAGEAFDKTAKLLGLPYPGGPHISTLAKQGTLGKFSLPRPLLHRKTLDFSFSGLKTAVRLCLPNVKTNQDKANLAAEFQQAVIDCLVKKTQQAIQETKISNVVLAGGVAANQPLRAALRKICHLTVPENQYCSDNGAMIAFAGYLKFQIQDQNYDYSLNLQPRWPLSN